LWLGDNQLTGEIPPEIGNLTNLTHLGLVNNQLTGSILPEIGNLTNLTYLRLSYNQLTGEIPETICSLNENIPSWGIFDISNNQLCPPYPECIEENIGYQDTSECVGDLNDDELINVQDVIILVNYILDFYYDEQGDMNQDGILNIQDVIILIGIILD